MSRWVDGHVPPWLLLIVLAVGIVGGGMLLQRIIRRRTAPVADESFNDAIRFAYGFIGLFYTFFIGFLVSSMWGQSTTAYTDARAEGATAIQLGIDQRSFNKADSDRIRRSLLAYEKSVISEWNDLGGSRLPETDAALRNLYESYEQVNATSDVQRALLTNSLANVDALSQARTVRLLTASEDQGLGWALWGVVLLISGLVVGTAILYGVEHPAMHYWMVAIVGLIVAANLFIIVELAYPYVGAMSAEPDAYEEAIQLLTAP